MLVMKCNKCRQYVDKSDLILLQTPLVQKDSYCCLKCGQASVGMSQFSMVEITMSEHYEIEIEKIYNEVQPKRKGKLIGISFKDYLHE